MSSPNTANMSKIVTATLDDNKGVDIQEIDVTSLTDVTDRMIICTATSTRHANALAERVLRAMRSENIRPHGIEGEQQGEWILVDFVDIAVHIMTQETREFYALEKLWTMTEKVRQHNNKNED